MKISKIAKINLVNHAENQHVYTFVVSSDHILAFYIDKADEKEFSKIYKKAFGKYEKSTDANRLELLALSLKTPLQKIKRLQKNFTWHEIANKTDYEIFLKFISLLEKNYGGKRKIKDFSEGVGVPIRKLRIICRLYSGSSCKELIDARVIKESKRRLQFTKEGQKVIAFDLGFADEFQFSKFFKKHAKITPKYFRQHSG